MADKLSEDFKKN